MNRPNKSDYVMSLFLNKEELHKAYERDLEKYCDDIEARLSNSDFNLQCLDKDILKLEKALDKACKFFASDTEEDIYRIFEENGKSKEKWKEWCLKDD